MTPLITRLHSLSEDTAGHEARSADAAQEAVSYQRDEIERSRVDFRFEHVNNHRYVLRNAGTHSAHGVTVDLGDLDGDEPVTTFGEFPAGHREPYLIQRLLDQTTTHVVVTWHYHPDDSDPQVTHLLVE